MQNDSAFEIPIGQLHVAQPNSAFSTSESLHLHKGLFLFICQSGSLWSCSIASIGGEIGQLDTHLNCLCTRCGKTCQEEGVAITRGGIKVNCIIMEKCRVIKRTRSVCKVNNIMYAISDLSPPPPAPLHRKIEAGWDLPLGQLKFSCSLLQFRPGLTVHFCSDRLWRVDSAFESILSSLDISDRSARPVAWYCGVSHDY